MVFTAIIAGQLEPPPRDLSRLAILCSLALDLLFPDPTGYLDVIMARLSNAKSHYDEAAHDKLVRAMREHAGALIKEALGDEAARQFNAGEPWENAPEKVSLLLKAFAKVIPEQQMPTPYFVYLFDMDNYDDKDHEFDGRGGLARQFVVRSLPEEARRNWATLSAIQQYRTLQIAFVQLFKDAADAAVSHEKYNEFATRQKLDEALGPNPRPDHEVLEAFGLEAMKRYRKNPDPALLRSAILLHFGLTQVVFFFSVPDPRGTPGPPAVGPPQ
ncbi:MAG TPA: hypothetical protein VKG65_08435 [Terriglobales bacterium]|nr:hypothetical protein [Terriglobales bacterium]